MASAAPIYPREVIRNMNMFALKRKGPGWGASGTEAWVFPSWSTGTDAQ